MELSLVLLPLLLCALLPHTHAATTRGAPCTYKGETVAHGQVILALGQKCMQIVCDNGSLAPKYFHGKDRCGCCEFRNRIYPPGQVFLAGCVKMTCERGNWKAVGDVERRCKRCEVFNDPHFWSFDRHRFDYHGECRYSLAQEFFSLNPRYGIFAQFKRCYTVPTCVHKTQFQDSPGLLIQLGETGLAAPALYNLLVNDETMTVNADNFAQKVTVGGEEKDVLVWRQGNCVRILGSSGLVLQQCRNRIDIWGPPQLTGRIHGLCGSLDGIKNNDFSTRDQQQFPLTRNAPEEFAESWKTVGQEEPSCRPGGKKSQNTQEAEGLLVQCRRDTAAWAEFETRCKRVVGEAKSNGKAATPKLAETLTDACMFDLCMITKKVPNPERETNKWLTQVKEMTEQRVFIENMVADCDVKAGECVDIGPPPTECVEADCPIDIIFNPGDFEGEVSK